MLERFRQFWTDFFAPLGDLLLRMGVSPNAVTLVGTLGVCAGALVCFPQGWLLAGDVVITVFVFSDMIDGYMARTSGRISPFGAFLDSTLDRLVAILLMTGLADLLRLLGVDDRVMWLIPVTLGVLAVASTVTVVQRILVVRRQALSLPPPAE